MKRALATSAIAIGLLSLGIVASAEEREPPPSLYEACKDKSKGDPCTAQTEPGNLHSDGEQRGEADLLAGPCEKETPSAIALRP